MRSTKLFFYLQLLGNYSISAYPLFSAKTLVKRAENIFQEVEEGYNNFYSGKNIQDTHGTAQKLEDEGAFHPASFKSMGIPKIKEPNTTDDENLEQYAPHNEFTCLINNLKDRNMHFKELKADGAFSMLENPSTNDDIVLVISKFNALLKTLTKFQAHIFLGELTKKEFWELIKRKGTYEAVQEMTQEILTEPQAQMIWEILLKNGLAPSQDIRDKISLSHKYLNTKQLWEHLTVDPSMENWDFLRSIQLFDLVRKISESQVGAHQNFWMINLKRRNLMIHTWIQEQLSAFEH